MSPVYWRQLILILIVSSILEVLSIAIIIPVINYFLKEDKTSYFFFGIDISSFSFYQVGFIIIFIFIFKTIIVGFLIYSQSKFLTTLTENISNRLFKIRFETKEYNFSSAEFVKLLTTEASNFMALINAVIVLIIEVIITLSILIFLLLIYPIETILLSILMFSMTLIFRLVTKKFILKLGIEREKIEGTLISHVIQSTSLFKEIILYKNQNHFISKFQSLNFSRFNVLKNQNFINVFPRYILELILINSILILIFYSFYSGYENSFIITMLAVFSAAAFKALPSINKIVISLQGINYLKPSYSLVINEFLKEKTSNNNQKKQISNIQNIITHDLEYRIKDKIIIENKSIEIHQGDLVCVDGQSGSGKTTLVDLLVGLRQLTSGEIFYNDIPLDETNFKKDFFGYVQQETEILEDTLMNNILFGLKYEQVRLNEVIELTNLIEIKDRLNIKIDNNSLSGGQKQKVGIARAIIRNPEVLILDEPTSSLDDKNEKFIIDIINKLKGKHTILLISHKKELKKLANKTITLKAKK